MKKILISACLVGEKTNYQGKSCYHPDIEKLKEKYELVLFCPEVEGGLKTPREPSEIREKKVLTISRKEVTNNFILGAKKALMLCKYLGIDTAVLKENSPSCGSHTVYDGYFQSKKIPGKGITTQLLIKNGITVYSEEEIDKLINN